jgi:chemotaxis protein MotA
MNLSVPFGFLVAGAMVYFVASTEVVNPTIFLSPHAAAIVLGGTLAAALICFPFSYFVNMFRVFLSTLTGRRKTETLRTIQEIVVLSKALDSGRTLSEELPRIRNPFLRESLSLMEGGGLTAIELDDVLEKRIEIQNERYKRDSFTFKVIGKFPPAFGLIGTTVGMIALLQGLASPNAFERLGPSMSVALVATFYGLILANVFLIPIAENLNKASEDDLIMRRIVVDGVKLLRAQKHPILVEEYLQSYITPQERMQLRAA